MYNFETNQLHQVHNKHIKLYRVNLGLRNEKLIVSKQHNN